MILNNYRRAFNMVINRDTLVTAKLLGNHMNIHFSKNQGVMLGDHVVVSRKVHILMPEKRIKGQVKIIMNQDAGMTYQKRENADEIVHIDVYYLKGEFELSELILELFSIFEQYCLISDQRYQYLEEERFKAVLEICQRIYLSSKYGQGFLYDLLQNKITLVEPEDTGYDHIHLLADIAPNEYSLIYLLALGIDNILLHYNVKPAKVRNICHDKNKPQNEDLGYNIKFPWKKTEAEGGFANRENVNQLLLKLAEKFGGLDELESFFNSYANGIFKQPDKKKRWGNTQALVEQLEEMDILKKGLLGLHLTKEGKELNQQLLERRNELDMEIRRRIRKTPPESRPSLKGLKKPAQRIKANFLVDYARTVHQPEGHWNGNLAVPETVLQAAKSTYLRGEKPLKIRKRDLHHYAGKSYTPINICLLLDCSASMNGNKYQTAVHLARHLLLSTKDKIAMVIFQERTGQVVVPFTRQENILKKGLLNIIPAGPTPMAHGLFAAYTLIKGSRVKNPLLIMITDGLPNVALWSRNPKADAIKAAELIKELKGKFICIGVESNQEFLKELCDTAEGNFYLTEEFDRNQLIKIVRYAKKELTVKQKVK